VRASPFPCYFSETKLFKEAYTVDYSLATFKFFYLEISLALNAQVLSSSWLLNMKRLWSWNYNERRLRLLEKINWRK